MMPVNILVEGPTDEFVAKRLLKFAGLEAGRVYGNKGKTHLLQHLPNYNKAARFAPWFVLVDLDTDYECALKAIEVWLPDPAERMRFRIVVRAIEAWLMADREQIANFLAVAPSKVQHQIELDHNPKETLISIARTSRNKSIREELVPRQGSGARVGPLYTSRIREFIETHWRPDIAANECESLRRCILALSTLAS